MNAAKFKNEQTILCQPFVGDDNSFHYIYKMINIINQRYYIGIHSTKKLDDGYCGSGSAIISAYKKYGYNAFVKLILSFHKNASELEIAEAEIVTEDVINDPKCYNINCGGSHHPVKTVTCRDLYINKNVRVPQDEYYAHPERYISHTKGQIKATDITGNIFMAYVDDPRFKTGEIWDYVKQFLKNTFPARIVATGQNIRVHKGDPRLLTGEVVHIQKGRAKITKDGVIRVVEKKDLQSFLDSGWVRWSTKGIKRGPSRFAGSCRIWKGDKLITIHRDKLNSYLAEGWKRGTGPKRVCIYKDGKEARVPLTKLNSYLADGWIRGTLQKNVLGKISIHRGDERKFIRPDNLNEYINDGWKRGLYEK